MTQVTRVLDAVVKGDPEAATQLIELVYEDLRKLAAHQLANEVAGQTLQPTALVHEAWLRVSGNQSVRWQGRAHFFGAAAQAMRRILIDNARRKKATRRGGSHHRVDLHGIEVAVQDREDSLLALDEVLDKLAAEDPQKADLVKLRYFIGLSFEEVADILGVSVPTAKRWWAYARAWLFHEMQTHTASSGGHLKE
jgi:RNA polymerase sigma factor (TIGR02999 family)